MKLLPGSAPLGVFKSLQTRGSARVPEGFLCTFPEDFLHVVGSAVVISFQIFLKNTFILVPFVFTANSSEKRSLKNLKTTP